MLTFFSCSKMPEGIPLTEAQKKFTKIIADELKMPVIVRQVGSTFWAYVPLEESFIVYKAAPGSGTSSVQSPTPVEAKPSLKFVETLYIDRQFQISYDISSTKNYGKDPGMTSAYTESFTKIQQNIMSAIQRAFEGSQTPPTFIVLIMADIKRGVELESVFYLDDLLKAMSIAQILPHEEFTKRYLNDFRGREDIIGDKEGKHLNYRDIPMTEFLARQIDNRVRFKYQQSAFGPSADAKSEILKAAQETLDAYGFKDYNSIELKDLSQ